MSLPPLSTRKGPSTLLGGSPLRITPRAGRAFRYGQANGGASPSASAASGSGTPSPLGASRTKQETRIEQLRERAGNVRVERVLPTRKIAPNLKRLHSQLLQSGRKVDDKVPLVLVSVGKYNPVHLIHIHMFEVAKHYLERHTNFAVVGGLICPSHDKFVRSECRGNLASAIPARRRAAMCRVLTRASSWIDVCRWEITRTCGFLDFPAVLETTQRYLRETLSPSLHVMYLCGIAQLVKCTPETLLTYGCICVARVGREEEVADAFASQHPGSVHVAEDSTVLHYRLAGCSSTKIRRLLADGDPKGELADYVGVRVAQFMAKHGIAMRVAGRERWSEQDTRIPELQMVDPSALHSSTSPLSSASRAGSPSARRLRRKIAAAAAPSPSRLRLSGGGEAGSSGSGESSSAATMSPHHHATAAGGAEDAALGRAVVPVCGDGGDGSGAAAEVGAPALRGQSPLARPSGADAGGSGSAAFAPLATTGQERVQPVLLSRWNEMRDEPSGAARDEINAQWFSTISSPRATPKASAGGERARAKAQTKAKAEAKLRRAAKAQLAPPVKRAPTLPELPLPAHRKRNYVSATVADA